MVARYTNKGWEIVTQRAHGIIAAQIAFNWQIQDRPPRWLETILAIAEHDDAENELDGEQLLTSAKGPLNYDMKSFDLDHCCKLSSLTITKSRYISLLTSMHMQFLYGKVASLSVDGKKFLTAQKSLRSRWRKELGLTESAANKIYDLVEWCDALSLLVCTETVQPEKRSVEISRGPDRKMYHLTKINEDTLEVIPWPFEVNTFEINYDYRVLKSVEFTSSASFRDQFLTAEVVEKKWTVMRTPASNSKALKKSKLKNTRKKQ